MTDRQQIMAKFDQLQQWGDQLLEYVTDITARVGRLSDDLAMLGDQMEINARKAIEADPSQRNEPLVAFLRERNRHRQAS